MVQEKLRKKLLQHLKRFWHSFKWLIKEQPGSGKEIEVKAIIHKLKYLLKQKQELKNDFYIMQETLHKIMSINKSN